MFLPIFICTLIIFRLNFIKICLVLKFFIVCYCFGSQKLAISMNLYYSSICFFDIVYLDYLLFLIAQSYSYQFQKLSLFNQALIHVSIHMKYFWYFLLSELAFDILSHLSYEYCYSNIQKYWCLLHIFSFCLSKQA